MANDTKTQKTDAQLTLEALGALIRDHAVDTAMGFEMARDEAGYATEERLLKAAFRAAEQALDALETAEQALRRAIDFEARYETARALRAPGAEPVRCHHQDARGDRCVGEAAGNHAGQPLCAAHLPRCQQPGCEADPRVDGVVYAYCPAHTGQGA